MELKFEELIEEFFNKKVIDKYPSITLKHCRIICRTPFKFIAEKMGSQDLKQIRLKYLGTFKIYDRSLRKIREDILKGKYSTEDSDLLKKIEAKLKENEKY